MMKKIETFIDGLFIMETNDFRDERGNFQKLFNYDFFRENGLDTDFCEFYYSISKKNVIRGMHFQLPPCDHSKLVYVSKGRIRDVVLDLRTDSKTYKQFFSIELDDVAARYLYIPKGLAHGFLSLEDDTIVNYAQTSCYSKEHDCGVKFDSFGFNWRIDKPIVSDRDNNFENFVNFKSSF